MRYSRYIVAASLLLLSFLVVGCGQPSAQQYPTQSQRQHQQSEAEDLVNSMVTVCRGRHEYLVQTGFRDNVVVNTNNLC